MSNRRLVPMPAARRAPAAPQAAPLTAMKTWHAFAFLIVTAIALYCAKWPILLIAALVGFFRGLYWLCDRYPRTMRVIVAIFWGLMRR
jgi:hypothetical protein